jgi:hypothetical protein
MQDYNIYYIRGPLSTDDFIIGNRGSLKVVEDVVLVCQYMSKKDIVISFLP